MIFFCDFETRSAVDIRAAGADVYARHPSTDIICMGWAIDDGPVQLFRRGDAIGHELLKAFDAIVQGATTVAHNAPFELAIWNYVGVKKYGWPELKPEQVVCTMARAYAMGMPGSLEKAAPAAGIKTEKDMAGNRVMLQISQPRAICDDGTPVWYTPESHPEKFERVYDYCKKDVEIERELYKRTVALSPQERALWLLDQKINQRGIQLDLNAARTAIRIVEAEQNRLDQQMREVTGNQVATCTANKQLTDWITFRGVETEGVAKADVIDLLEKPDLPSDVRAALLFRQDAAKTSTKKLSAMIEGACEDGRIRGTMQYHGANTGRWAGRRLQVHNFPRPKLSQEEIEGVFQILEGTE